MSWIDNRFSTQAIGSVNGELDPYLRAGQENDQHPEVVTFWKGFKAACACPIWLTLDEGRARNGVDATSGRARAARDPLGDRHGGLLLHLLDHLRHKAP